MKPLRAHDYPSPVPEPDFRGLRRIMAGFILAILFCVAMIIITTIRTARMHHVPAAPAIRCICMGRCMRH